MARLSDMLGILKSVGIVPFAIRVRDEVLTDSLFVWASALAYSWLFAIFPFFIFLLALIPHLPEKTRAETRSGIEQLVADRFPSDAQRILWRELEENSSNLLHRKYVH